MPISAYPVTPSFVAEIGDVDLSHSIPPTDLDAIKEAFARYAVLIFPDQQLSPEAHLEFARQFGPLETTIALHRDDAPLRLAKEFADVSNLDDLRWKRDVQRATVCDMANSCEQEGIEVAA